MDRWYYAKKWFSIFPGFLTPAAPPFLAAYYEQRRRERSLPRLLLDGLVAAAFRAWVPHRARKVARKFGLDRDWVRRASAIGRSRFVDPNDIAVFRIETAADADRYMRRYEYAGISKRINPAAWKPGCVLADKGRFAERCAAHCLPTPPILARAESGKVAIFGDLPPEVALKLTGGQGGTGFEILSLAEPRDASLARALTGRRGDWIVQPRVDGHPGFRDIALSALSTARITTMLDEAGRPEVVTAVLRFAGRPEAVVDNLTAGGLLAPIDLASGRLGPACYGRKPGDVAAHPVTGAPVEGRILPDWPETLALVLDAHARAVPEYSMIGWDVGIAAGGPILIEGNGKPGLFAAQRATRTGIGETRFGALIAHHLATRSLARGTGEGGARREAVGG